MKSIFLSITLNRIFLSTASYRLVVIGEEEVPLAAEAGTKSYWQMAAGLVLSALLLAAISYLLLCRSLRRRIRKLEPAEKVYCGWNRGRLERTVRELEAREAEKAFAEIEAVT